MPENGVPARFTVHVTDCKSFSALIAHSDDWLNQADCVLYCWSAVPDAAASYEFYSVALFQPELQGKETPKL